MLKKLLLSFLIALQNIRSRIFHTLLSILGIVIGVAALVAILSLIDGMEQYARDQIASTTSIKAVMVSSNQSKRVNNVRIRRDSIDVLTYEHFKELKASLKEPYLRTQLSARIPRELKYEGTNDTLAAVMAAYTFRADNDWEFLHGREITANDVAQKVPVAVLNEKLAKDIIGEGDFNSLIGKTISTEEWELEIIGIIKSEKAKYGIAQIPISIVPTEVLKQHPPQAGFEAENVEAVEPLEAEIKEWLAANFENGKEKFSIISNTQRVEQAAKAFLLFRLIMGLIVGISVLVGGIGVMNVLLISVNERTKEIGVCKAVGAKRKDIMLQFLAESVSISTLGSTMGLIIGILGTLIVVPIVKMIVDVPFQAAYTWTTLLVVGVVAILVGIMFGTYPAMRASRLDPVEAIRKE